MHINFRKFHLIKIGKVYEAIEDDFDINFDAHYFCTKVDTYHQHRRFIRFFQNNHKRILDQIDI